MGPRNLSKNHGPDVEDLDGVEVIMDDVIIAGGETTHDERLMKFLKVA